MNWTKRRERCRELLNQNRCVHPGSVFDPISARIGEEVGYEICTFAGSLASLAVLGAPDHVLVTLSEFAAQAYRINRAFSTPMLADADHGFGNALNVMRTIEELETAGVSMLTIEDTLLPYRYGASGQVELISVEEGIGKMRAALAARQDPALAIFARTAAIGITGMADAMQRMKAYQAAGVDGLFLLNVTTAEQLDEIHAAIKIPIVLGNAAPAIRKLDYLATRGVRICMQGHATFRAAVQAIYDTMKALRAGATLKDLPALASEEMMRRLTRDEHYRHASQDYLALDLIVRE